MSTLNAPHADLPVAPDITAAARDLHDPTLFLNREVELLRFQERVLEEACDPAVPLLERVRFLAIVGSNMAEFYMVRIAALRQMVEAKVTDVSADGLTAKEQLRMVRTRSVEVLEQCRRVYLEIVPQLATAGVHVLDYDALDDQQRKAADDYFEVSVFPVLTPLAFDPRRPFPHISNLSLNLALLVRDADGEERFARVKVPKRLPRLIDVGAPADASAEGEQPTRRSYFVWMDQLITAHLDVLFPGTVIIEAHPFRVTRDAEMDIQELEADDLLETIEQGVRRRRFGAVVRVTATPGMPEAVRKILLHNLEAAPEDLVILEPPLGVSDLFCLYDIDRPDLKFPPHVPVVPEPFRSAGGIGIFAVIRERDQMLHRPFESFDPLVRLLQVAAQDPKVLAIKITLYRAGRNSPVVEALLDAAREGKEVTALVELRARFDEERNVDWARALEAEGVHVVYGLVGLKIHAKVALIVRAEGKAIRRYVHTGTGNYNTLTATQYTDIDLFTADETVAEDASEFFNALTGYAQSHTYETFAVSPHGIRERLERDIHREIELAEAGRRGRIVFKTNSLTDHKIIRLLYKASIAGVTVDLVIRGICCLKPGVPGISDNIRVRSIVGRFLEHTRIYHFGNDGEAVTYIGSADLMSRNLDRRVEVLTPVRDPALLARIADILGLYLADNTKARVMSANGAYRRVQPESGQESIDAQESLIRDSAAAAS